jgi:hypothetical protein
VDLDVIDILGDLMTCYGETINGLRDAMSIQNGILELFLGLIANQRPVVRKRTIQAMGVFAVIAFDPIFDQLSISLIKEMEMKADEKDYERLQSYLFAIATLCRTSPERMSLHLNGLMTNTLEYVKYEDDELKEQCLQTLEAFADSMMVESAQLNSIIQVALESIKYDPNYLEDDDDAMDTDEEDAFEEEDDENFSDDDDVSWKVRRASSKLLCSVIRNVRGSLSLLYPAITPVVISRFSEREEVVRTDIFQTFIDFVTIIGQEDGVPVFEPNAKRRKGFNGQQVEPTLDQDTAILLHGDITNIVTAISKQLNSKSVNTTMLGFVLLTKLINVLRGGLESCFHLILPHVKSSLTIEKSHFQSTNTNIKIQVLQFLKAACTYHEPESLWPFVDALVESVMEATFDKFYKVRTEALDVIGLLVKIIFPTQIASPQGASLVKNLYDCVWNCLRDHEMETEVADTAIVTLGEMLSRAGHVLDQSLIVQDLFPLLHSQLQSETTRGSTINAIQSISDSQFAWPAESWTSFLHYVGDLLTKSDRHTVTITIPCLESLLRRVGSNAEMQTLVGIVRDVHGILKHQADGQVLPLALELLTDVFELGHGMLEIQTFAISESIPVIVETLLTHYYSLGSDSSVAACVRLWKVLLEHDSVFKVYDIVLSLISKTPQGAHHIVAKSIGHCGKTHPQIIHTLIGNITTLNETTVMSLLVLGEIGVHCNMHQLVPTLQVQLHELFALENDDIKNSAAYCLGHIAIGNPVVYVDFMVQKMRAKEHVYLYTLAIHELVLSLKESNVVQVLWNLLFECVDTATGSVIADSIGHLVFSNPAGLLQQLLVKRNEEKTRWTSISAFRYVIAHSTPQTDKVCKGCVTPFVESIKDSDLAVRKAAMQLLNTILHSKPEWVRYEMDPLIPHVVNETTFKVILIYTERISNNCTNGSIPT